MKRIGLVFLVAMAARWLVFSVVMPHPDVIMQPDSKIYLTVSESLLKSSTFYPLGETVPTSLVRMPGYPVFMACLLGITGGLIFVILAQIILDSVSCTLIYYLGENISKSSGVLSGLLASLNLGMVTYSHFLLSDSLYLFFWLLAMIALVDFMKSRDWNHGAILGIALGVASLIRPIGIYVPVALLPFVLIYLIRTGMPLFKSLARGVLVGALFVLCIVPWMIRNYEYFGRFSATAQAGEHLLQYVVPFSWEHSKGMPFIEGMKKAADAFRDSAKERDLDSGYVNPFDVKDLQVRMALDYLREEPLGAIAKAWLFGMAKNLFVPAIFDLSYLFRLERQHFFYTEGKTTLDRAWNFVTGIKGWFGWAMIASMVGLGISRVIQVWGFILLFRKRKWEAGLFLLIIGYFLVLSGPVGYAKYRLPFEPILIVLLAIGLKDLWNRWRLEERIASLTSGLRQKRQSV